MVTIYGKRYKAVATGNIYTVTQNGNVICKRPGLTSWVVSAMGKALFDINVEHGHLVKLD